MAKRLREQFVLRPDSEGICRILNRIWAWHCLHGKPECFLRCGVRRKTRLGDSWEPIPYSERRAWVLERDP